MFFYIQTHNICVCLYIKAITLTYDWNEVKNRTSLELLLRVHICYNMIKNNSRPCFFIVLYLSSHTIYPTLYSHVLYLDKRCTATTIYKPDMRDVCCYTEKIIV